MNERNTFNKSMGVGHHKSHKVNNVNIDSSQVTDIRKDNSNSSSDEPRQIMGKWNNWWTRGQ